ncbi:MAG: T9SS type A sorting domain-containing protein [bacterium]
MLRKSDFDPSNPPAIELSDATIPSQYALQQNYPNPFNPSTTIEFGVPENHRGPVTLRIYNMLGQLVRELEDAEIRPGVYRKMWNGQDEQGRQVSSGVYIYQMRAGDFTASRKLVMMK